MKRLGIWRKRNVNNPMQSETHGEKKNKRRETLRTTATYICTQGTPKR